MFFQLKKKGINKKILLEKLVKNISQTVYVYKIY